MNHFKHLFLYPWCAVALLAALGCGPGGASSEPAAALGGAAVLEPPPVAEGDPAVPALRPTIVALGDSLTAGLGLAPDEAYPTLLQQRLDAAGLDFQMVNAGVSGDTSAGGLRRLDWALEGGNAQVLIVALGGNDALRGLPVEGLRASLSEIVERAQARGIDVVLAGMEAPPNFGPIYTSAFRRVFSDLAAEYDVALVPFLLEGVAGEISLNQGDGIHPNPAGARKVAETIWPVLEPIVRRRVVRSTT